MLHSFLGADSFVEEYMYFIVKNVESKILLLLFADFIDSNRLGGFVINSWIIFFVRNYGIIKTNALAFMTIYSNILQAGIFIPFKLINCIINSLMHYLRA